MTEYQNKMWKLQQSIFECPNKYAEFNFSKFEGSCLEDIPANDLLDRNIPDAAFVGDKYGELNIPKILFIGNNPNSSNDYFGPPHSISSHFKGKKLEEIEAEEFYEVYYTGNNNLHGFSQDEVMINNQGYDQMWGIQPIMEYLYGENDQILRAISFTNGIFCKGPSSQGKPSSHMQKNCVLRKGWLRKIIEILEPEIIFISAKFFWEHFEKKWYLIDEEDDGSYFNPDLEYAYKPWVVKEFGYRTLVMRIPHLTRKWCNLYSRLSVVDNELKSLFNNFEFGRGANFHRKKIQLILQTIQDVLNLNKSI